MVGLMNEVSIYSTQASFFKSLMPNEVWFLTIDIITNFKIIMTSFFINFIYSSVKQRSYQWKQLHVKE